MLQFNHNSFRGKSARTNRWKENNCINTYTDINMQLLVPVTHKRLSNEMASLHYGKVTVRSAMVDIKPMQSKPK